MITVSPARARLLHQLLFGMRLINYWLFALMFFYPLVPGLLLHGLPGFEIQMLRRFDPMGIEFIEDIPARMQHAEDRRKSEDTPVGEELSRLETGIRTLSRNRQEEQSALLKELALVKSGYRQWHRAYQHGLLFALFFIAVSEGLRFGQFLIERYLRYLTSKQTG